MWYFHVAICVATLISEQCIVGHAAIHGVKTKHECEMKASDWIMTLSDVQIAGRQAKVLFKCEKDPTDVLPKSMLK